MTEQISHLDTCKASLSRAYTVLEESGIGEELGCSIYALKGKIIDAQKKGEDVPGDVYINLGTFLHQQHGFESCLDGIVSAKELLTLAAEVGETIDKQEALVDGRRMLLQTQNYLLGHYLDAPEDTLPCHVSLRFDLSAKDKTIPQMVRLLSSAYQSLDGKLKLQVELEEQGENYARLRVDGPLAYGLLKPEVGQHKFIKLDNGKRYTNLAQVDVAPIEEKVVSEVTDPQICVEYLRSRTKGGQHANKNATNVRMVHKPTGITKIATSASQSTSEKLARKALEQAVEEHHSVDAVRKTQLSSARVRMYDLSVPLITDTVTGAKVSNPEKVFSEGGLEQFLLGYHGIDFR